MTFHDRLRTVMAEHNITPVKLAALTGIGLPNISRLLHAKRSPSLRTMQRVLNVLPRSVDVRWLLTGHHSGEYVAALRKAADYFESAPVPYAFEVRDTLLTMASEIKGAS